MNKFSIVFAVFLTFFIFQTTYCQEKSNEKKIFKSGIVNGKAKYLPKPNYSQEAKDFCANGKVEVEVLIGEDGNVISANAISGDELLRDSAVKAAQKAIFNQTPDLLPVKIKGIIVYNFVSERKCIEAGIVNKKAGYLPKPVFPTACRCIGNVLVQIIVDESGNVIRARGISGNPLLQVSAINAALKTKFNSTNVDGGGQVFVKALLNYNFNSDGTINDDINITKIKIINHLPPNSKPIFSPQPEYPASAKLVGASGNVEVEILIDEEGNVEEAKAISGNPLLRNAAEKAARETKFNPITLSGTPVKVKSLIVFDFKR